MHRSIIAQVHAYVKVTTLKIFSWRRGWDSNPRSPYGDTRSPGVPDRPLQHLSVQGTTTITLRRLDSRTSLLGHNQQPVCQAKWPRFLYLTQLYGSKKLLFKAYCSASRPSSYTHRRAQVRQASDQAASASWLLSLPYRSSRCNRCAGRAVGRRKPAASLALQALLARNQASGVPAFSGEGRFS
jgi:hypothetical protein